MSFKSRPTPHRFQPQSPIKVLRLEHLDNDWYIWLSANREFTLGSFLKLHSDGKVTLNQITADGCESETEVTG